MNITCYFAFTLASPAELLITNTSDILHSEANSMNYFARHNVIR